MTARSWDLDPDDIDATDYIVGSTIGAWEHDEESLTKAILVALTQVFMQAGASAERASEVALAALVPDEGKRTVSVSVKRDGDSWSVSFDFKREDA